MKEYTIVRAGGPVPLGADCVETPWAKAQVAAVEAFPWYAGGEKQSTAVRMLYDDVFLYWLAMCEDAHSFARVRELNGAVWEDSCVGVFFEPAGCEGYFELAVNVGGAMRLTYGAGPGGRRLVTPELARGVAVECSEGPGAKEESAEDYGWWVAAAVGLDVLSELAGWEIHPRAGEGWRGNFCRGGGKTDVQYGSWAEMEGKGKAGEFDGAEGWGMWRFE